MNEDRFISRKRIFGATVMVVIAILLSKVSGLVRDQIMAGYFGISSETDAFTWAYFIPNLFRILFAESLIVAAFIPIYSRYIKNKRGSDSRIFVNSVAKIMLICFSVTAAIIFVVSPQIGTLLSNISGNQMDTIKFVAMNRIMVFSLLTLSLSGLATGILNSHNIFTLPSLAPFVMNVITIIFVVTFYSRLGIYSMAIGVMAGSLMHLIVQTPQLRIAGRGYRTLNAHGQKSLKDTIFFGLKDMFTLNLKHEGVREIFSLMFPILLSLGAVQLNNSVDSFFALNLGAGNTTALTLSWRVANLPLGVFSVAIITVLYPLISRQAAGDDIKGIKESFSLGVREIGYMMLPATMGLVVLSYPIIKVLFERGSFTPDDTLRVSLILVFHSLGLVFFGLLMIVNRIFYAFKNVRTPLKVASISILINFLLDWVLIKFMGVSGLALSTALVALFNVVILLFILRKKVGSLGAVRIAGSYWKILVSTAVMGIAIYYIWKYISVYAYRSLYWMILGIFGVIVLGAGIYIGLTIIFKMDEIKFVLNMFKREKKQIR
ncbi:MAG: murein biosynthesis integral membrane protein MurJ [Actinobacteria bacterium]|nr:murein biosynthesis integral membrane protein MurJ [Actinomycetota bacterium]